jgi:hypothetical protein
MGPITQLKPEIISAFAKLIGKLKSAKDQIEDHKDDITRLHVTYEEVPQKP